MFIFLIQDLPNLYVDALVCLYIYRLLLIVIIISMLTVLAANFKALEN